MLFLNINCWYNNNLHGMYPCHTMEDDLCMIVYNKMCDVQIMSQRKDCLVSKSEPIPKVYK